jgi:hypothetical protein
MRLAMEKKQNPKEHPELTGRERKENERQKKPYNRSNERQPCLF